MAVFRVEKNKDYTVMSNLHLKDNRLSLKAKGLLSLMLSLPEDWDYTLTGLAKINKEGVDAIRSAVAELEQERYIRREFARKETGEFDGNRYVIYEAPHTDSPLLENPLSGNPLSENPTQIKTNRQNTNNPHNPPEGDVSSQQYFEYFWSCYPRKTDKQRARRAFNRLKVDRALLLQMANALKRQKTSRQWLEANGQYIPHPSTWLNGRRWEDEPVSGRQERSTSAYTRVIETEEVPCW